VVSVLAETDEFQQFEEFMKKYNKVYKDDNEFNTRFKYFKESLDRVSKKNEKLSGGVYGITRFSDFGVHELVHPKPTPTFEGITAELPPPNLNIPKSWDWTQHGAVTPVQSQGLCGSDWAFSAISNMEGVWFLGNHTLVELSAQQLLDCSTSDFSCDGGWPYVGMSDMLQKPYVGRIDSAEDYPYTGENNENCQFDTAQTFVDYTSYINYCNVNTSTCSMNQIQQLLLMHGPLSICLNSTTMLDYNSGIDHPAPGECDPGISHCITLVGYGVQGGQPFWKLKNSWGTEFGVDGYFYLYRDDSNNGMGPCGINRVISTVIL